MNETIDNTPWPKDARRDRLIGDWHMYQRTGGHRTSTDDLITAWFAAYRFKQRPMRYLDLGCGIGSVLLMVCHRLRPPLAVGIEAQAQSVLMARRSIDELSEHEIDLAVLHSDFRDADINKNSFDLITGSPPYFPLNAGVLPSDSQRRDCRFESRGGVEDYVAMAVQCLSADGRFYVVHQTKWQQRVHDAAKENRLFLGGQANFWAKADQKESFLSVFELTKNQVDEPTYLDMSVRESGGKISNEYMAVRSYLGVDS